MTRRISVAVAGQTFASLAEAAEHFNVSLQTAARRLREGSSPEQAFGLEHREHAKWPDHRGKPFVTSAGTFRTVRDAAAHFGIGQGTLAKRLRDGWPPDEAVELAPHKRKPKTINIITCQGKTYPNAEALADAFGVNRIRAYKRLNRGWTPEQAVELDPPPPRFRDEHGHARSSSWKSIEIVDAKAYPGADAGQFKVYVIRSLVNSKEYVGISVSPLQERLRGHRAAARKGLKSKLYNAMRRHGVDNFEISLVRSDAPNFAELQQQEFTEIARRGTLRDGYNTSPGGSVGTAEEITVAGVTYPSRGAAAEHFGIDVTVFNLRVSRLGWRPQQAAEIEPRKAFARRRVEISGLKFKSLKSAAEHFGLDYSLVYNRVTKNGWTIEQSLGAAKPPGTVRFIGVGVEAFGMKFPSFAACARHFGVKSESLRQRVIEMGTGIEAAIRYLQTKPKVGARRRTAPPI